MKNKNKKMREDFETSKNEEIYTLEDLKNKLNIIAQTPQKEVYGVIELTKKKLTELKEKLKSSTLKWEKSYDKSEFHYPKEGDPSKLTEDMHLLEGCVDRQKFSRWKKRENEIIRKDAEGKDINWYQQLSMDAELFVSLGKYIDYTDFVNASPRMISIIRDMASMKDFSDKAWKDMFKQKGYKWAEIYGSEGAYQILLAFQRAIAAESRKAFKNEGIFSASGDKPPKVLKIKLTIADKRGKKRDKRYSRVYGGKVKQAEKQVERKDDETAGDESAEHVTEDDATAGDATAGDESTDDAVTDDVPEEFTDTVETETTATNLAEGLDNRIVALKTALEKVKDADGKPKYNLKIEKPKSKKDPNGNDYEENSWVGKIRGVSYLDTDLKTDSTPGKKTKPFNAKFEEKKLKKISRKLKN